MKEGQIQFQGTFDDMAKSEKELYNKWKEDVTADTTESEYSDVLSGVESAAEERDKLKKQVSRILELSGDHKSLSSDEGMTTKCIY